MIVCPQCQFENPDHHKFCQRCGISLVYKSCDQCGAKVEWSASHCPGCGTVTGQIWLALVSPPLLEIPPVATPQTESEEEIYFEGEEQDSGQSSSDWIRTITTPDEFSGAGTEVSLTVTAETAETAEEPETHLPGYSGGEEDSLGESWPGDALQVPDLATPSADPAPVPVSYLDPQQRYQVLASAPLTLEPNTLAVQVLDTHPLQPSWLSVYQKHPTLTSESTEKLTIPEVVQPYLSLSHQFPQQMPVIHDAWQEKQQTVIILKNYDQFPTLLDSYREPGINASQLLHWLNQIIDLWIALTPLSCRQSVLEAENLRVHSVAGETLTSIILQALYSDPANTNLTLQDLGQFWHHLFNQSDCTQFNFLHELINGLIFGRFETPEALKAVIETELMDTAVPTASQTRLQLAGTTPENAPISPAIAPAPVRLLSLESAGKTDVGKQRDHNEDFFGIWTDQDRLTTPLAEDSMVKGLYILCDGMGGHDGGEVASQLAVDTLHEFFQTHWQDELPNQEQIQQAIFLTNQTIYQENKADARSGSGRMGTTLVMALVHDTQIAITHVGDSRLYRLQRDQPLEQITIDHEVGMREIQRGIDPDIAYSRPDAYQLTQALGPRDNQFVRPDIQFFTLEKDTLFILASDGLTDNDLLEIYQETHLEPLLNPNTNLEKGVQNLIDLGNQYNGHDNITAIVIRALVKP